MATLYEIESAIMDCVDAETGEIINEEQLTALLMERNAKLEGVALWIKNLDSDVAAIRAEREALEKRQKVAENKAASLRRWLAEALNGQKFSTARVAVSYRGGQRCRSEEMVQKENHIHPRQDRHQGGSALRHENQGLSADGETEHSD